MALTEDEKLTICKHALQTKISEPTTFNDFVTLVGNMTPENVRTLLVSKITAQAAAQRQHADDQNARAVDVVALASEINNL